MLRCEAGLRSKFSLPECFYECIGCSANSIWKHLGRQKRKVDLAEGQSIESGMKKGDSMYWDFKKKECVSNLDQLR